MLLLTFLVAEKGLPLAVESFTFCKEPLGINDATKEIIRMANVKVYII